MEDHKPGASPLQHDGKEDTLRRTSSFQVLQEQGTVIMSPSAAEYSLHASAAVD